MRHIESERSSFRSASFGALRRRLRQTSPRTTTASPHSRETMSDDARAPGLSARAPIAETAASSAPTNANAPTLAKSGSAGDIQPRRYENWGARSVTCYEKLEQVGEGTYGQVYMARCRETGDIVALKKVRMDNEKEGFPITAIREIKILKKLRHVNVIDLKEIVTSKATDSNGQKGSIYLVFEYMDHDLTGLADRPDIKFSLPQIKCYMKQLLTGLHYCHINNILHRDIKGSNLLINNQGILKLADFGLARSYTNENAHPLTNRVITLWYRPPELLLGSIQYGPSVDIWSAGCILAELLHGKPILPGKSEIDQLELIFKLCGTPTKENWPESEKLLHAQKVKFKKIYPRRVREIFSRFTPSAKDLLERFLALDPAKRITAQDALDSDWFWEEPLACKPHEIPRYEPSHEFQTKKRRQEAKREEEQSKRQRMDDPGRNARPPQAPPPQGQLAPGQRAPPPPPGAGQAPTTGRYGVGSSAAGWSSGKPQQKPPSSYAASGSRPLGGYGSIGGGMSGMGSKGGSYSNLNLTTGATGGSYSGYRGVQTAGWAGGSKSGGDGQQKAGWAGGDVKKDITKEGDRRKWD